MTAVRRGGFDTRLSALGATLLWVLRAVVLVILVWLAIGYAARGRAARPPAVQGNTGAAIGGLPMTPGAVSEFSAFVMERSATRVYVPGHGYTAEGIRKLTAALNDIAGRASVDAARLRDRLGALHAKSALLQEPRPTATAHLTREAFTAAAEVMAAIQQAHYPHLDRAMAEARAAALGIRPDRPLVDQSDAVERFFERSHDLVRAMID